MVVAWGTGQVGLSGEVVVLAKAHTDFDVQAFRVTFFDETRMASCGQGSVRLWRLRGGALRSCPVDLGEHHVLQFTDLAFKQARDGCPEPSAAMLFVCSHSGHILEIDCQCMVVRHARRLLPTQTLGGPHPQKQTFSTGPGIAISSLSLSPAMCAVGSADGYLRLWPLDFSSVLLEAGEVVGTLLQLGRASPGCWGREGQVPGALLSAALAPGCTGSHGAKRRVLSPGAADARAAHRAASRMGLVGYG